MKARNSTARLPRNLALLVFLFCLFFVSTASAQGTSKTQTKEVILTRGKTVSHIALALTRDANNWRNLGIKVYRRTRDGRILISKRRYNKLQAGDIVSVPASMVRTEEVQLRDQSIAELCADYTAPSCARSVRKINSLASATVKLSRVVYVPTSFAKVATEQNKVQVATIVKTSPKQVASKHSVPKATRVATKSSARTSSAKDVPSRIFWWTILFAAALVISWYFYRRHILQRRTQALDVYSRDFAGHALRLHNRQISPFLSVDPHRRALVFTPRKGGPGRAKIEEIVQEYKHLGLTEIWEPVETAEQSSGIKRLVLVFNNLDRIAGNRNLEDYVQIQKQMDNLFQSFRREFKSTVLNSTIEDTVRYDYNSDPHNGKMRIILTPIPPANYPNLEGHAEDIPRIVVPIVRKIGQGRFSAYDFRPIPDKTGVAVLINHTPPQSLQDVA